MNTVPTNAATCEGTHDLSRPGVAAFSLPDALGWARHALYRPLRTVASPKPPAGAGTEGPEILVVDDNRDAADSLAQLFGAMGATVSVAYGAKEALRAMAAARPKIAIIDISMPLMNGYELAAQIRASDTFAGVMLVALTGWGPACGSSARTPATDATGFDQHLTKPADVRALTQLLDSITP